MFLRQCFRNKDGKRHAYWALVESYRTDTGPRQRVVAWLGKLDEAGRLGIEQAARDASSLLVKEPTTTPSEHQLSLFDQQGDEKSDADKPVQPQWIEVNASGVRVENCRQFGGPWLALEVVRKLQLDEFLKRVMPQGREHVTWWRSALILVVARLCRPSSELYVAEQWYPKSALPQLLGVPAERVDDNRLYRTLDQLLPYKAKLEAHLKNRLGELFDLEYDLLMHDITSTYFEKVKRTPRWLSVVTRVTNVAIANRYVSVWSYRVEESQSGSRLVDVECGLLLASQQYIQLERRRVVEGVHSTDGGGSRVSHSQERPQDPSDLASEGGTRFGTHLRLFPGVRVMEDA